MFILDCERVTIEVIHAVVTVTLDTKGEERALICQQKPKHGIGSICSFTHFASLCIAELCFSQPHVCTQTHTPLCSVSTFEITATY